MFSDEEDDEDEQQFRQGMSRYISSFSLNDAVTRKSKASAEYEKLHKELEYGYGTTEERIRTENLICYLLWQLDEKDDALKYCNNVLDCQKTNIIALSNKAWFLFYSKEFSEAMTIQGILDKLSATPNFETLLNEAKAELAYSYSRFGPRFQRKSIKLFEEAIAENKENILWKFGLALTYRRQTHILTHPSLGKTDIHEYTLKALNLFHEIMISDKDVTVRAKAWCELGLIVNWNNLRNPEFDTLPEIIRSLESEECFHKALDLCPNDIFVLERCGRQFRYFKQLEQSKKHLNKAIAIRETPFSLHHLALTLIKQVEVENRKQSRRPRYFREKKDSPKTVDVLSCSKNQETANASPAVDSIVDEMSSLTLYTRSGQDTDVTVLPTYQTSRTDHTFPTREKSNAQTSPKGHDTGREKDGQQLHTPSRKGNGQMSSVFQTNKLCIKSPKKTICAPNNPLLKEAERFLKRAIALSKDHFFATAHHDLGLVYRQLNQLEIAIKEFNKIALASESTKLEKVKAIEQIGICKFILSEDKECSPENSSRYYEDAKKALFKAVRLMASLCSTHPGLKDSLHCYPTLLSMLTERKSSVQSSKELAELHRLVGEYKEAISFYEEVMEILQKETPGDVLLNLLEIYKHVGDYEKAFFLLDMMRVSEDTRKFVSTELYVSSHFDAWADYVKSESYEKAINCLQDAFRFSKQNVPDQYSSIRDVVVLCKCDDKCAIYTLIKDNLEKMCGLKCKFNTDDCLPGRHEMKYLEEILGDCDAILLLLHDYDVSRTFDFLVQTIMANESFRTKTMLVADEANQAMMKTLPNLKIPEKGTDMVKWIQDFLSFILKP